MFVWVDVHLMETGLLKKKSYACACSIYSKFSFSLFHGRDRCFCFFVRYGSKAGE